MRKLGYGADIVASGFAALEALKSTPYDIIFMDCQMPEMDGFRARRAIRTRERSSGSGIPRETSSSHHRRSLLTPWKATAKSVLRQGWTIISASQSGCRNSRRCWNVGRQLSRTDAARKAFARYPPLAHQRNLPLCRLLPLNRAQFDRSSFSLRQQLVVLNRFPSVPPRIRHTTRNQKVRRCNPTMESSPKCRRGQKLLLGRFAAMVTASMVGVRTRRNSRVGADDDWKFKNSVPGQEPDIL